MGETTFIYGLIDPRDQQIRYVGKSGDPEKRLREHMRLYSKNRHLTHWLKQLKAIGINPTVRVIQKVSKSKWKEAERHWIRTFKWAGVKLTNLSDGGQGFIEGQRPSLETRSKMVKNHWARKGIKPTNYLSDDDLLRRLQLKAQEVDRVPLTSDFAVGKYVTILRRFGTWNAALELAGICHDDYINKYRSAKREHNSRRRNYYNVSAETLLKELRTMALMLGHTPTEKEFKEKAAFSTRCYWRIFGSWCNACSSAGLVPNKPRGINLKGGDASVR